MRRPAGRCCRCVPHTPCPRVSVNLQILRVVHEELAPLIHLHCLHEARVRSVLEEHTLPPQADLIALASRRTFSFGATFPSDTLSPVTLTRRFML